MVSPLDLAANQRSVLHLAPFFEELQASARQLTSTAQASQRGYFSTREEDATRDLLVSYWHARNALFELITHLRRASELPPDEQQRAFLIGFAAALILVDAACFLREVAEARPLVKRKLNEPAAALGIPAGVYDQIQRSLLSTRHAWHLYHAVRYFEHHEGGLASRAAAEGLEPLLRVIQRLRHRLEVPASRFATARLKQRGSRLQSHFRETLLGRAMYGLQKLAGTLVADKYLRLGHQPALPPRIARGIEQQLQPGDVLAVRKEYALTNYFLPGYWPHVALYLGPPASLPLEPELRTEIEPYCEALGSRENSRGIVLESMRDGVQLRGLGSPFGSDSIVILRPRLAAAEVAEGLARSLSHRGKPYDFSFDFSRSDRLVCTEVVYRGFDGVGQLDIPLVRRVGRPTLSGDDLVGMCLAGSVFDAVAVYAPSFSPRIVQGTETRELIQQARAGVPQPD